MGDNYLKPIKALRCRSDLRAFSQIRALDTKNFLPSLWHSLLEFFLNNSLCHIALEVFTNSVYFYPHSLNLEFEKKHLKVINEFISALNSEDQSNSKNLLHTQEVWEVLIDIFKFVPSDPESKIAPIKPLLDAIRISVVEKTDDYEDYAWEVDNAILTIFLFENENGVFLLHPKTKPKIPAFNVKDEVLTKEQSDILEAFKNDDLLMLLEDDGPVVFEEDESPPKPSAENNHSKTQKKVSIASSVPQNRVQQEIATSKSTPAKNKDQKLSNSSKIEEEKVSTGSSKSTPIKTEDNKYQSETFCGSSLCLKCFKEIAKTSYFLVNSYCCNQNLYKAKAIDIPEEYYSQESTKLCSLCEKPAPKPSKNYCVCCFLNIKVWDTKNFSSSDGCGITELNTWTDISQGKLPELIVCSFCNEDRNRAYVCFACPSCKDLICLTCLRRNPYIAEGICQICVSRRKITLLKK
jgi:hypothetical protein